MMNGNPQTLFALPGLIAEVRISPDGQKFVCRVIESKSDVWVMENFDPAQASLYEQHYLNNPKCLQVLYRDQPRIYTERHRYIQTDAGEGPAWDL